MKQPDIMRFLPTSLLVLLCLPAFLTADPVKLVCELDGCSAPPKLYRFNGLGFTAVAEASVAENGAYEFSVTTAGPTFYYVGQQQDQLLPLILGPEAEVRLRGDCGRIKQADIQNSAFNTAYEALKKELDGFRIETSRLINQYRRVQNNEAERAEVATRLQQLDDRKLAFLDSLRRENPYFGAIASLNTYLSYQNNPGEYPDEIAYFANEYFRWADFSKEVYAGLPWVYEAFKSYTLTLSSINLPAEQQRAYLNAAIDKTPAGSLTRQMAFGGVITILRQRQQATFPDFAERFAAEFAEKEPAAVAALQEELQAAKAFMIGGTPPDFSMATPSGEMLSTSDFRGKVLLLDFWASWCGPCRRENPHVVGLYQQYKDQGFAILGVSLDRNREKWEAAISQDQLTWRHVSDLQGWKNEAAQLYGVRSIPHTVLLDEQGRIIARNLRGETLERKLAELFGG